MSRGDRRARAAFYERYFDLLLRLARAATTGERRPRRPPDEHLCLDVVHDAVLKVVRTVRPVTGGEGQLVAWLQLVVRSVAYDLLRREQRRRAREQHHHEQTPPAPAGGPATGGGFHPHTNGAELAEQLAWLRDELRRLDPRIVELIELRYQHS